MTALLIFLVLLIVALVVGLAAFAFRTREVNQHNEYLVEENRDLVQRAIDLERLTAQVATEAQYLKASLTNVLQRPAHAILTDENMQQLGAIIRSFVNPGMEN